MSLRDELHAWLAGLPLWQQHLARQLAAQAHLTGQDYDEARNVVLAAHGALPAGETALTPHPLALDDLPGPPESGGAVRLLGLGNVRGVGAVADDQELRFSADALTVIYGPNAVGKTTYVRALKRVCRAVDCDATLRGNVFGDSGAGSPSARVDYTRDGEQRAQQIDLAAPDETGLDALSVFDSRCAELYLSTSNAVAFVPSALRLLARLAATQDRLRRDIDEIVNALLAQRPVFRELDRPSQARTLAESVSASSNIEALRAFAALSDEERARMAELRAAVAAAEAQTGRSDAEAAQNDGRRARELAERLRSLAARVSPEAAASLRAIAAEADLAEDAAQVARAELAATGLAGIGGSPWQRMWQAAREFVESEGRSFPPGSSDPCPLCLQPLGDEGAQRFQHFERHIQSSLEQQARVASSRLQEALARLDQDEIVELEDPFLRDLADRHESLHELIQRFLSAVSARIAALRAEPTVDPGSAAFDNPAAALEEWAAGREQHAEALLTAMDPDRDASVAQELAELEDRDKLSRRLGDVAQWIASLTRVEALRATHRALATNRITTKQRELSDRAVTGALDARLNEELARLNCDHLPVDLHPHTALGETQVALRLAGAAGTPSVSEILSEGEQRALSLAFFFAEIGVVEHAGGIVVDDPVSSLDDERRSYIAQRLVAEAERRQVIVFTHDLPFMLDLIEQAEQRDTAPLVEGIWRFGASVGRVDERPPFSAMKFRQRVNVLTDRVANWDNQPTPASADDAWRRVCDLYADMRTTWERAVEERLFRGVVQRFQREVKTLKLRDVVVSEDLVAAIEAGMTRCSLFVHDAPAGTRTSLPTRMRLAQDVEQLRAFERATRPS